jgi:outer membrane protein OmpU
MIKRSIATAVAFATLSAGVANAAEDFEIGVSGFIHSAISASGVDHKQNKKDMFSIHNDNLLNFSGATVLDNGLKAIAVASFSFNQGQGADSGSTNQNNIFKEELYVGLGGSFGQFDLGRRMNAASLMHTFIPSAGVGVFGVDNARISSFVGGNNNTTTATSMGDNSRSTLYANRIQYFTPRIEGLQLAASFTPDTDSNLSNVNVSIPNNYKSLVSYKNEYSVAGNYAREFGDFGVKSSVGYTNGQNSKNALIAGNVTRDFEALTSGLSVSAHGFTLGGAYSEQQSGLFRSGKERRFGGGAKYETGPWGFGVSYLQRKADNKTNIDLANGQSVRKAHFWEAGTSYALGSGVTTGAGVYYNDNVDNIVAGTPEDSVTGLVNLSVNF